MKMCCVCLSVFVEHLHVTVQLCEGDEFKHRHYNGLWVVYDSGMNIFKHKHKCACISSHHFQSSM